MHSGIKRLKESGKVTTETRSVDLYDALSVYGSMNILLVEGSEGNIELTQKTIS